jgi:UDP-N-acetylmuramate dehydrogenase
MITMTTSLPMNILQAAFLERLEENVSLARYTSARLGGLADVLVRVNSIEELAEAVSTLWAHGISFTILGGGSNMLVSDAGVREVVILNRARAIRFDENGFPPMVWAESGANFGALARQAGQKGLSGLEWAGGIPGTLGGAVIGNAGAHGSDLAGNLMMAEILHQKEGQVYWTAEDLQLGYRSSRLKQNLGEAVVLAAQLRLAQGDHAQIKARMAEYLSYRRKTQPPGASMGSMFKNPQGDYAGRLIEAAGLKGLQVGGAQISDLHGNFFINHGTATARDVYGLIRTAQQTVKAQFGVQLELEIVLIGDWTEEDRE